MERKILIFSIFVLIGLAVFMTGYLFSLRASPVDQQALINNSLVDRFNKTEEKYVAPTGIFALTPGEASFPHVSNNGDILYYIPRSGEIRSLSLKTPAAGSTLIAKIPPNASSILWGANKTLLAVLPLNNVFYDLTSNFSKKYGSSIKGPAISKIDSKIAYTYFDQTTGNGNVRVSDPQIESYKNILSTRFAGWQISWLDSTTLALIKPSTLNNTGLSFYTLDITNNDLQNVFELKSNLEITFSNNGQKLVYSYVDHTTQNNQLFFMDLNDKTEVSLNSSVGASKCTWSIDNKTIYCADKSSFVSFDTSSPSTPPKDIFDSSDATNASNLILNSSEDYLIFKNSQDGMLYGLSL